MAETTGPNLSPATRAALEHFNRVGARSRVVPEWGITVFWHPATGAERDKIAARDGSHARFVEALILKALDAQGKPLFTIEDRVALMTKADSAVTAEVALAILAAPSAEDVEKN